MTKPSALRETGMNASRGRQRIKRLLLALGVVGMLAAVACSQGSYPLDIFYEMHYQQSYKSHEPPRLAGAEGAVAWYPPPQSTSLNSNTGAHLFSVNCSICHGVDAKGTTGQPRSGAVLTKLVETYDYKPVIDPPDLTDNPVASVVGTLEATTRPFGPTSVMPPFGKLLTPDERLAIAQYIDTLPK